MSVCFCVNACVCVCWWKKIWHTRRTYSNMQRIQLQIVATQCWLNRCTCACVCLCAWFDAFVYGDLYEYGMEYETICNRRLHIKALLVSDTRMFFFYPFAYDLHIIKPSKWVTTTRQERKKKNETKCECMYRIIIIITILFSTIFLLLLLIVSFIWSPSSIPSKWLLYTRSHQRRPFLCKWAK